MKPYFIGILMVSLLCLNAKYGLTQVPNDSLVLEPDQFPIFQSKRCLKKKDYQMQYDCSLKELLKFIYAELEYPDEARANEAYGHVLIQYDVGTDGVVYDARIAKDIGYGCGEEALRVIRMLPAFIPAKHQGQVVKTMMTTPILFKQ